jgi:steroid 5-alpha reductase family enzyme
MESAFFWGILLRSVLIVLVYFTLWYAAAAFLRNASIADTAWGLGFVILAVWQLSRGFSLLGMVIAVPVWTWGIRLALHIGSRNFRKPEDFRYAAFRREWGRSYPVRSYFQLFLFQGLLMFIISLPFLIGIGLAGTPENITGTVRNISSWGHPLLLAGGVLIWLEGFLLEVVADLQLKRFTSDKSNKGTIMQGGLWRYSRHPNYFGEALSWWGIYLLALSVGTPFWTIVGPLAITLLIRYVSGVPMLEKRMAGKLGYEEYAKRTSVFIPLIPRKKRPRTSV